MSEEKLPEIVYGKKTFNDFVDTILSTPGMPFGCMSCIDDGTVRIAMKILTDGKPTIAVIGVSPEAAEAFARLLITSAHKVKQGRD